MENDQNTEDLEETMEKEMEKAPRLNLNKRASENCNKLLA